MRRILAVLAIVLISAFPVLADINQKADLNGGNVEMVRVKQVAWNYGSGDIKQNADVRIAGNIQIVDQDSVVTISDDDFAGNINNTMNGINLIRVDLDQYAESHGQANVDQTIEVEVEGNIQRLDQDIIELIS